MYKENILELGPNGWIAAHKMIERISQLLDLPVRWLDRELDHAFIDADGITVASMSREVTRWEYGEPKAGSYIVFLHF